MDHMLSNSPPPPHSRLRDSITNAYRMDENTCLNELLNTVAFSPREAQLIQAHATEIVLAVREGKAKGAKIDALLHQYDLSTDEGIALMCLAEALLRIPDTATMDKFISDKLSTVEWKNHLGTSPSFFINAATWSLLLTGKIYAPKLNREQNWFSSLKRAGSRLGVSMVRPVILKMMQAIGKQFVMGEDIESALTRYCFAFRDRLWRNGIGAGA